MTFFQVLDIILKIIGSFLLIAFVLFVIVFTVMGFFLGFIWQATILSGAVGLLLWGLISSVIDSRTT